MSLHCLLEFVMKSRAIWATNYLSNLIVDKKCFNKIELSSDRSLKYKIILLVTTTNISIWCFPLIQSTHNLKQNHKRFFISIFSLFSVVVSYKYCVHACH